MNITELSKDEYNMLDNNERLVFKRLSPFNFPNGLREWCYKVIEMNGILYLKYYYTKYYNICVKLGWLHEDYI